MCRKIGHGMSYPKPESPDQSEQFTQSEVSRIL